MPTTNQGVADTETLDGVSNSAIDAFLSRLEPKGADAQTEPSEDTKRKTKPETTETQETEGTDATEETPDSEEAEGDEGNKDEQKKTFVESDEVFVKVKVGDQELEVPVKDLKRLHGQEAALTRRSQEVAEQRKATEQQQVMYAAGLDRLLKSATAQADQFRQVNWMDLARNPQIPAEVLTQLQQEAQRAIEQETFLKNELGNFVQSVQKEQQTTFQNRAMECVKTLGDQASPYHIDGFNKQTYDELRNFAVKQGLDKDIVNQLVEAPAFKLLHMAMLYAKGSSKTTMTKPTNKSPKKIVKTSTTPRPANSGQPAKQKEAMKALQKKGSLENAANAFMSGWETVDID